MLFLLSLFSASASETCADQFAIHGSWVLPSSTQVGLDRGVLTVDGDVVGKRVVEAPVIHGDRVAFVEERTTDGLFDLVVYDATTGVMHRPIQGETPKQLAFGSDGRLAYVNGVTGISAVYVLDLDGEPRQLTNIDLVRVPGQAPEGFVPSPSTGLQFVGTDLVWEAEGRTIRIPTVGGAR